MSTYLTDMKADVRNLLKDTPDEAADRIISDTLIESLITEQVLYDFSMAFPLEKKRYYYGTAEYNYDLPSDWQDEFSIGKDIEFDVGNQTPTIKERKDWIIYEPDTTQYTLDNSTAGTTSLTLATANEAVFFNDGDRVMIGDDDASESNYIATDGNYSTGVIIVSTATTYTYDASPYIRQKECIRFLYESILSSEAFLFTYTTAHTLTESSFTVPTTKQAAFKYLSAAIVAQVIANHYKFSSDSSIDADSVDYLGKAVLWEETATKFRNLYLPHLPKQTASVKGEYDIMLPWGRDHVFHPKSWR